MTKSSARNRISLKSMTVTALLCAVLCILCPFSLNLGPVPVTMGVFAVYLISFVPGFWHGTAATLLYLLLGVAGLPVFAGYTAGPAKLFGPTGGYLLGYVFLSLMTGFAADYADRPVSVHRSSPKTSVSSAGVPLKERSGKHLLLRTAIQLAGMVSGLFVCYLFGTLWFTVYRNLPQVSGGSDEKMTFLRALSVCVFPFLLLDAGKTAAALLAGNAVRSALKRAYPV